MINETRASTERHMLEDIQELLRQGEEVNQQDSQGATLVRLAITTTLDELKVHKNDVIWQFLLVVSILIIYL